MLGYTSEDLLGTGGFGFAHPDDMPKVMESFTHLMENPSSVVQVELRIQHKDGSWRIVEAVARNLLENKAVEGIVINWRDITERKKSEEAIRRSEEYFRALTENALDGILILNGDGSIRYESPSIQKLIGYGPEEREGRSVFEHIHPDDLHGAAKNLDKLVHNPGSIFRTEIRAQHKDGSWHNLEVVSSNLLDNSAVKGVVLNLRDITERKRAEDKVRLSEIHLRELLGLHRMTASTEKEILNFTLEASVRSLQSPFAFIGIMSADEAEMTIHAWSKGAMEQCAVTEKPIHFPIAEAGLWGEVVRQRRPIIVNDYGTSTEFKKGYPKSHVPIKRFLCIPVFSASRIVAVAAVANKVSEYGETDISALISLIHEMWNLVERKKAEEGKQRMEEQLRLAGRLAAVGELSAGVAHELNNPIAAIQGFAQLLTGRNDLDETTKKDLGIIYREAQRAAKITQNLLSFARRHEPEKHLISLNEVIEKTLELRAHQMKVNNIEVVVEFATDLPKTTADFFQMQQVFVNIINNAEQAMVEAHRKGRLVVKTQKAGNMIQATFADDGPGISEDNLKRIFDPFFTTKEVGKGTGLGLSICYGIVEAHGGRIYARSKLGQGATVVVEIPIVAEGQ
jgi:PAS domain S-box-containing protein